MITSIWSTPEFEAISRDFVYEEYVQYHWRYQVAGTCTSEPVSKAMYRQLEKAFDLSMEENE